MSRESELDYLNRRAAEELDQAEACHDSSIAQIHREMAMAYAERIARLRGEMPLVTGSRNEMAQPATSMR